MSFIKRTKKSGPKMDPCGTPDNTSILLETALSIITCFRPYQCFKFTASCFKLKVRLYGFFMLKIFMQFIFFFAFSVALGIKPRGLILRLNGKLGNMVIDFTKKSFFKICPSCFGITVI